MAQTKKRRAAWIALAVLALAAALSLGAVLCRRQIAKLEYLYWLDRSIARHTAEERDTADSEGWLVDLRNPATLRSLRDLASSSAWEPVELYGLSTIRTACGTRPGPVYRVDGRQVADGGDLLWEGFIGTYAFPVSAHRLGQLGNYYVEIREQGGGTGLRLK